MIEDRIFIKEPISFHGTIPVFSCSNDFTANYEKISEDHLESFRRNGTNPFIPEDLWIEFEKSTIELIKRYSKTGERILDVGVGLGRVISQFPDLERYGMDISFGYLEVAQSKGINVCYSLVEDMPYREALFDLVVCTDVLEHVFDLNMCCAKILSVLRKGGILIVRVPFREKLSPYLEVSYPYRYAHLRNFDEYSLRLLFERVFDCEYIEIVTAGYMPSSHKMRWPAPFQEVNWVVSWFVSRIKNLNKSIYQLLLKKLYDPIVINIVVRKR